MKILVGNTGFVGTNLKQQIKFDYEFNSKNIQNISECPDGLDLYLSCLPATKWLINQNIIKDFENIKSLISILKTKNYNRVYLLSTIDVYCDSPLKSNEDYNPNFSGLNYGSNRLIFEHMVKEFVGYLNLSIIRLPALFGHSLKKNIIYDLLNNNNLDSLNLNSYYQWYDLKDLNFDIQRLTKNYNNFQTVNFFTEPIYTEKLVKLFFPNKDLNYKSNLVKYDYSTKFFSNGYIYNEEIVLNKIKNFLYEVRNQ
jgi:hypothetical protein